jgi:hypothetical protein
MSPVPNTEDLLLNFSWPRLFGLASTCRTIFCPTYSFGCMVFRDWMLADGLATAVMIMASGEGLRVIDQLPSVEGFLVNKQLDIFKSEGFPG